jgi:hypothetical protein
MKTLQLVNNVIKHKVREGKLATFCQNPLKVKNALSGRERLFALKRLWHKIWIIF